MLCPNCKEELKLEGDFYSSIVEYDGAYAVEGEVVITFVCAACNVELGEYSFELELDVEGFATNHDDEEEHELTAEVLDEYFDEHVNKVTGAVTPGATATVKVSCICGKSAEYQWHNYETIEEIAKEFEL